MYTVNWTVLSKDDGLITKCSYVFTFDDISPSQTQNIQTNPNTNGFTGYTKNYTTSKNIALNFDIISFNVGQNNFTLGIEHENGAAADNIRNVFLEFNNPEKNFDSGNFIIQECK